jgi:CO/xanthine dehydrogenase FAD-binding subunit
MTWSIRFCSSRAPAISETAHRMANNQIRNLGTIGGNLVNAVPSADLPPILIALRAYVTLVSPRREDHGTGGFLSGPT